MRLLGIAAAVAGAADTAQFMIDRRERLRQHPARAAGGLLVASLWAALIASLALDRRPGRRSVGLASAVFAANAGLLASHARARLLDRPRVLVGPALAALALAATAASGRGRRR
jgi:hypothetical protein